MQNAQLSRTQDPDCIYLSSYVDVLQCQHVRSLLNALGGSHRTVMALELMHDRFGKLRYEIALA